jgi:hypothetical protein
MKQDTQPLLIFMHIPKTAGTTFVDILRRQYDQHELREVYPGYQEQLDQLAVAGDLDQWRMVLGHLRYGVHGLLARPSTYLTLLRTPERQVLSHYNHLMNKEVPLHEQIMRESGDSLEGFLEHSWARNLQTQ